MGSHIVIGNVGEPPQSETGDLFVLGVPGAALLVGTFDKGKTNLQIADMGGESTMEDLARVFELMVTEVRGMVGTPIDKKKTETSFS